MASRELKRTLPPGMLPPWQPGQSGNPAGRPKLERDVAELARGHTATAIATLAQIMTNKKVAAVARVRAAEVILERGFGKAPQRIVLETDVAAMSNPQLDAYIRAQLLEALTAPTIEGDAEEMPDDAP